MFERKSQIVVEKDKIGEDALMNLVLEAGAEDMKDGGDSWEVISDPAKHDAVLAAIAEGGDRDRLRLKWRMVPKNLMKLEGKNAAGHDAAAAKRWKSRTTCRTFIRISMRAKKKSTGSDSAYRSEAGGFRPGGIQRMRVFGIDCGTERTGYGVIDSDGRMHRLVAAGCIRFVGARSAGTAAVSYCGGTAAR